MLTAIWLDDIAPNGATRMQSPIGLPQRGPTVYEYGEYQKNTVFFFQNPKPPVDILEPRWTQACGQLPTMWHQRSRARVLRPSPPSMMHWVPTLLPQSGSGTPVQGTPSSARSSRRRGAVFGRKTATPPTQTTSPATLRQASESK